MTTGEQFAELARRLTETGEAQLRKDLYKAINDAAKPITEKICNLDHLKPYMPDRYAAVLAGDLAATVSKLTGTNPGVSIRVRARARKRKVQRLDDGTINHPVYARGPRAEWNWSNWQRGGMKAGFFSDVTRDCAPQVRASILEAMAETARKVTSGLGRPGG